MDQLAICVMMHDKGQASSGAGSEVAASCSKLGKCF